MSEKDAATHARPGSKTEAESLHPVWRAFMQYCNQLRHGEIERLCIQDGLPVFAESTTKKVKFTS